MNEQAEKDRLAGDEEKSFVMYMKYVNMVTKLQSTPDFIKEKSLFTKMLGGKIEMKKTLDRLQVLKESLQERYEIEFPPKPLAESTSIAIDDDPNESAAKATPTSSQSEVKETIDCKTLFNLIQSNHKLLIMDCRSEEDYEQSKINYKYMINVPEKILKLGMTANKIQTSLPNDSKVFWELRLQRQLIFVDWSSKLFNRNSPVWHLREILTDWDDEEKKPEILLLSGGYDEWKTIYPMTCLNPQFSPPKPINGDAPVVEDIEYPNWEDIQMKDTSMKDKSIPHIDRSMKPSAAKSLEKTQLQLLEESDKLVDKSLRNEKELLDLETDYKHIVSDKENNEDSTAQEQAFMFKIWELQSKEKDIQVEEKSIKEQLGQSKEFVEEPQQTTKMVQLEQQIREKELERQQIHVEREKKKKEREEALKYARDRKPQINEHRTPPKTQRKNEIILSPKELTNHVSATTIPSFDRSSKPMQAVTRQIFSEQDFAPVYGRVVSLFPFSL